MSDVLPDLECMSCVSSLLGSYQSKGIKDRNRQRVPKSFQTLYGLERCRNVSSFHLPPELAHHHISHGFAIYSKRILALITKHISRTLSLAFGMTKLVQLPHHVSPFKSSTLKKKKKKKKYPLTAQSLVFGAYRDTIPMPNKSTDNECTLAGRSDGDGFSRGLPPATRGLWGHQQLCVLGLSLLSCSKDREKK